MQRHGLDDAGLFIKGEGLNVFVRIAFRQALEPEKWIEVALPPIGDCCILADYFYRHKDFVDGFIADRLTAQAQIFGSEDKLV